MKLHQLVIAFVFLMIMACNKRPKNEHYYLSFENRSASTVFLADHYWIWSDYDDPGPRTESPFRLPKELCSVAPGQRDDGVIPLTYWLTYEYIYTKTDKYYLYILSSYFDLNNDKGYTLTDFLLATYELSLEDLASLDYQLSYPPDERMNKVQMIPPFESYNNPLN